MLVENLNKCLTAFVSRQKQLGSEGSKGVAFEIERRSRTEFQQRFENIEIAANERLGQRNQMKERLQAVKKRAVTMQQLCLMIEWSEGNGDEGKVTLTIDGSSFSTAMSIGREA